jgi:hypothetical protein
VQEDQDLSEQQIDQHPLMQEIQRFLLEKQSDDAQHDIHATVADVHVTSFGFSIGFIS